MEIKLIVVGKTKNHELIKLIGNYVKRINFFNKFQIIEVNSIKSKKNNENEIKKIEGENILKKTKNNDLLFLLDEKGENYSSRKFADFLKMKLQESKTIIFVIGGAYGFSKELYSKSNGSISLSKMTFSHQIIRLFFSEQLYRAFTILNNHPYHND